LFLERPRTAEAFKERLIEISLFLCAFASVLTTIAIIFVLFSEAVFGLSGAAFFQEVSVVDFFTGTRWSPVLKPQEFGVLPLIVGTLWVTGVAAVVGLPIGVLTAVYLSEYAKPQVRNVVKPFLELLAGIPTIVYGFFGLAIVTPYVIDPIFQGLFGFKVGTFNALAGGIVVGIMIIPMVSSLTEDALRAVPRSLREAGYALGSTKFDVVVKIVLPAAFSGVVSAFLLAISRAVGETMAVAIACGSKPNLTANPLEQIQTMTAYIVQATGGEAAAGTVQYQSVYAVGLTLFLMTLVLNIISQWVMRRYREVYQ
jgi:phosphate transport system permease protein